jgi:hypothetical protein
MVRFFVEGNIKIMGTLSLLFLVILSLSVVSIILALKSNSSNAEKIKNLLGYIKSLALFTLVFAIFGQILGLVQIFDYLAGSEIEVAANILAKGIKITFHPTIYGIIIYLFSILVSLGLNYRVNSLD